MIVQCDTVPIFEMSGNVYDANLNTVTVSRIDGGHRMRHYATWIRQLKERVIPLEGVIRVADSAFGKIARIKKPP